MRDFKTYYLWQIKTMLHREFPDMPSYNHFVELAQHALPAMLVKRSKISMGWFYSFNLLPNK